MMHFDDALCVDGGFPCIAAAAILELYPWLTAGTREPTLQAVALMQLPF